MLRSQIQQRQGRADVVVEIALGFENLVPGSQHGGHHLFRGGLAHAAGDLHHGDVKPVPVGTGQRPQGKAGVVDLDVKFIAPDVLRQFGAQAARRTGLQCRVNEVVAVKLLPHPGQEQAAGDDLSAVGTNGRHRLRILSGIPPDALHGGCDLLNRHRLHRINLFS